MTLPAYFYQRGDNSQDLHVGSPSEQIRDNPVLVRTRSLLEAGNEPVPEEITRDLLLEQWDPTDATGGTPVIIVQDDMEDGDLADADYIIIACENIAEVFEGHEHRYAGVESTMIFHFRSIHSRQRMYNLMGETRRIIYKWILALEPYHSLRWDGFQPLYTGPNMFEGVAHARYQQDILPIFQRFVTGEEYPAGTIQIPPNEVLP